MTLLLFALLGCPHPADPATVPAPAVEEALAPRPFTADQIRDGFPAGTHIRLAIAKAGTPTVEEVWDVTAADADGCTIASTTKDESGAVVSQESGTSRWDELVTHASFPAAQTERTDARVEVPGGAFDTWLYTVRAEDGSVKRLHFAKALPGPPVSFTIEQDGVQVFSMTLLERTGP